MVDYIDINQLYITAVENGDTETVEHLLLQGADIDTLDKDGMIALIVASQRGYSDIASIILQHNIYDTERDEKIYAALWHAISENHINVIKIFLHNGANINRTTPEGFSPLMIAIAKGHYETVKFLLENGADATYENQAGQSAILLAQISKQNKILRLLQKYANSKKQSITENDNDEDSHTVSKRRLEL